MERTNNLNIDSVNPLPSPEALKKEFPLSAKAAQTVLEGRKQIQDILDGKDNRMIVVVGPCSIHDPDEALEYSAKLKELSEKVSDRLLPVMRLYFEKPRTILGWKGLIYDPYLNGKGSISEGLRIARSIMLRSAELGLPTATELLETVVPQYITDLLCWTAIGARTAESQTHRQMASGLSMPIGFKNATDGGMEVAVHAVKAAASPHTFLGVDSKGKIAEFNTRGNRYGHLVLRGGAIGPNYQSEYIAFATELLRKNNIAPNIMIDCSHANSKKQWQRQHVVLEDTVTQRLNGNRNIVGVMIESNILPGNQSIPEDLGTLKSGISITDACIGWEETEEILLKAASDLKKE